MAYFACGKAALTGTDKVTRANIAKNVVTSRFISSVTGKSTLRGVIQADIMSGRDVGYVTNIRTVDRIKAAARASAQAGGNTVKQAVNFTSSIFNPGTYSTATARLHDTPSSGNVGVGRASTLSKKTLIIGGLAGLAVLYVVTK